MQWNDEAIILSAKPYGENSHIVQLFTPSHGRHAGLMRGKNTRAIVQPGNHVAASWNARLSEHLGMLRLELLTPYATLVMQEKPALLALSSLMALTETCFPERDPHPRIYYALRGFMDLLDKNKGWPEAYAAFEYQLLSELGFALDLHECAATGTTRNLTHISPKSGRAVCAEAALPYREKLLPLPAWLLDNRATPTDNDIAATLQVTGHFLAKALESLMQRPLPEARARYTAIAMTLAPGR